jgi:ArsR family transcriptional regulator
MDHQPASARQSVERLAFEPKPPVLNCTFAQIRGIEYSNVMPHQLRVYKASVFQALAHPTRIAIVEILREGEISSGAMQAKLGIEQANLSQHLTILRSRQIVVNRKGGNQVFYSLANPVLGEVLDIMGRYCQTNLNKAIQMMGEMKLEAQD